MVYLPHIKLLKMINEIDKLKTLAVLYAENKFTCLEQESFDAVLYIKLATTLCNFLQFNMLVLYRKNNSNIAQFDGYVTTKHFDLIVGDFNEHFLNEELIIISLQSLGLKSDRFRTNSYQK